MAESNRPWADRVEALEQKDGHYADYAAFLQWIGDEQERCKMLGSGDFIANMDDADSSNSVCLYSILCDAFDGREIPKGA